MSTPEDRSRISSEVLAKNAELSNLGVTTRRASFSRHIQRPGKDHARIHSEVCMLLKEEGDSASIIAQAYKEPEKSFALRESPAPVASEVVDFLKKTTVPGDHAEVPLRSDVPDGLEDAYGAIDELYPTTIEDIYLRIRIVYSPANHPELHGFTPALVIWRDPPVTS